METPLNEALNYEAKTCPSGYVFYLLLSRILSYHEGVCEKELLYTTTSNHIDLDIWRRIKRARKIAEDEVAVYFMRSIGESNRSFLMRVYHALSESGVFPKSSSPVLSKVDEVIPDIIDDYQWKLLHRCDVEVQQWIENRIKTFR